MPANTKRNPQPSVENFRIRVVLRGFALQACLVILGKLLILS